MKEQILQHITNLRNSEFPDWSENDKNIYLSALLNVENKIKAIEYRNSTEPKLQSVEEKYLSYYPEGHPMENCSMSFKTVIEIAKEIDQSNAKHK